MSFTTQAVKFHVGRHIQSLVRSLWIQVQYKIREADAAAAAHMVVGFPEPIMVCCRHITPGRIAMQAELGKSRQSDAYLYKRGDEFASPKRNTVLVRFRRFLDLCSRNTPRRSRGSERIDGSYVSARRKEIKKGKGRETSVSCAQRCAQPKMPGSLNYSPSGSEGGRSLGAGVGDLERSLVGVDLTTTPGKKGRREGKGKDKIKMRNREGGKERA